MNTQIQYKDACMHYSEGRLGRIFVLRIDDGEDFLAATKEFIQNKSVQTGTILFLGALRQGRMVTGPEELCHSPGASLCHVRRWLGNGGYRHHLSGR